MDNPFFEAWTAPFGAPPFERMRAGHFEPAYARGMADHAAEITAIAQNPAAPDFENTIAALEDSGRLLSRVDAVFSQISSAETNDELEAIELKMAPLLSRHWSSIYLDGRLFARVEVVWASRDTAALDAEALRVLERYRLDFLRAGAALPSAKRARLAEIGAELAELGAKFGQNVLADEQNTIIPLEAADLDGVPDDARADAAATARDKGLSAPYAVTASRTQIEPFLKFAHNRAVREKLFNAWTARGANENANNNLAPMARMLDLRAERAALLGYDSFAAYKLADGMAKTPDAARDLLMRVWEPAKSRATRERDALQVLVAREGGNFALAPWDWRYYAEIERAARYAIDENAVKPYFPLDAMIEAAFDVAHRLFGLSFHPRADVPVYHPDMKVWEVRKGGEAIALFYGDYFARSGKRSGAWMSSFRDQEDFRGRVLPLVINTCNFPKGDPALLTFDDARTLFHEFGHALHGMLSDVRYPRLSGTNVARDFVELPSQLYEHWLEQPDVLSRFARHHASGEAMPRALLDGLLAARNFDQGFATVEFLASAIVDMDFHTAPRDGAPDPAVQQAATLARIGMPREITMRHAGPHFLHVFSGDGYAAGYYAYLWAEVLDADGFAAFRETGDIFAPALAARLGRYIYAAGGTRDYALAYRMFRGRDPDVAALLEGRGLNDAA